MSTPISDIPDDIDFDEIDESIETAPKLPSKRSGKKHYFAKYKDYLLLFVVALITLRLPLDKILYQLPHQLLIFGDIPIRALLLILVHVLTTQIGKFVAF